MSHTWSIRYLWTIVNTLALGEYNLVDRHYEAYSFPNHGDRVVFLRIYHRLYAVHVVFHNALEKKFVPEMVDDQITLKEASCFLIRKAFLHRELRQVCRKQNIQYYNDWWTLYKSF